MIYFISILNNAVKRSSRGRKLIRERAVGVSTQDDPFEVAVERSE